VNLAHRSFFDRAIDFPLVFSSNKFHLILEFVHFCIHHACAKNSHSQILLRALMEKLYRVFLGDLFYVKNIGILACAIFFLLLFQVWCFLTVLPPCAGCALLVLKYQSLVLIVWRYFRFFAVGKFT